MPDFGLTKAVARAARKGIREGASEAKVLRPGQLDDAAPKKAPIGDDALQEPAVTTPTKPVQAEPVAPEPVVTPTAIDADVEAKRLSQIELGDYALDESFQTNFDTINTTDDIKAIIADVSAQNAGRIDEARRGVITHQELQKLADDLDINADVVRQVFEREAGGVLNAETILAARQVLNSSAERIWTLAKKISTTGDATDLDRLIFRRQIQWHREYQTQFMGARAEAGRALNAFGIPTKADSVDFTRMRELVDAADGYSTDEIANAISLMDNPQAIHKATRKYTQSKLMGTTNELFINSILSGLKTHIINATGNIMMQAMSVTETAVAARLGRFFSEADGVQIGEASALLHGTLSAWRDGFKVAAQTMRTGVTLDDAVKFESVRRRSISAEHLLTPEQRNTPLGQFAEILLDGVRVPIGGKPRTIVPGVGQIIRAPTERVMASMDEFFKTLAYRGELERQAYLNVMDQVREGAIDVADAAAATKQFLEDAPLKAQAAAEQYTRYVTFQNSLGPKGQAFQLALRRSPVTSLVAPFVRTPVNIFTAGILDRSPVALFRRKFWSAMRAGGRERDMMLARVTMGTATSALVATMVAQGLVTGRGPSNPDARRMLEASGWQPYSIKVGDTYHSYSRAEPLAFVIGATADAAEIIAHINYDPDGLDDEAARANDVAAAVIAGIANNTISKTYLQGVVDFFEMMTDPPRYFDSWTKRMGTAMVPYSAFRNSANQIDDPYIREAWSMSDALQAKSGVPGWSEELPPSRDIFGNYREYARGSLLGPMSPFPDTKEVKDATTDELIALMEMTREVPITMPGKRIEGMKLTSEEYDELVRIARTEPHPRSRRTFKEELQRVMESPAYIRTPPFGQVELLRKVQHDYDDFARAELESRNPLFEERLIQYRQRRDELRFGD